VPTAAQARPVAEVREPAVGRLVVVSHRLPFVVELDGGSPCVRPAVGGLVTGVQAFLSTDAGRRAASAPIWVGWAGPPPPAPLRPAFDAALATVTGAVPVRIDPQLHGRFYDGFSNRTLWPLCHAFPSNVHIHEAEWQAYVRVNEAMRDALLSILEPGDLVWVHDFHFMLLPELLRASRPDVAVAYFHHIPFPTLDILRILPDPWSRALLRGILGADVVGFHTYDDVRKALRAAERLLGQEAQGGALNVGGRSVVVEAFPIGVDFGRWDGATDDPEVRRELERIAPPLEGRKVVLSVDRLDYTKGILNRLDAFERLLERRPDWRERVTLVVVAVPSRGGVEAYRQLRARLEESVGRVNGKYGTLGWTPVLYQHRSLDHAALAALYLRADVGLVTPLRDGMNLVAKEFLASRRDEDAVLVLSDTAGAARELGEAVLVNPFHVDGVSQGLEQALEMGAWERRRRCRHMRSRLARYDVARWGSEQVLRVREARRRTEALEARHLQPAERERLALAWSRARRRLVLLDYDGTLVPYSQDPAACAPGRGLTDLLGHLVRTEGTKVAIISGRDGPTLERWLEGLPLTLVAEHGARVREPDGTWSTEAHLPVELRRRVLEVMQVFADRLPGAFVEEKASSLAWHWRAADPDVGAPRARELAEAVRSVGNGPVLRVVFGRKVVEVRPVGADKGGAARRLVAAGPWDVVLAAGDDATDEDLFAALPADAWSIRVGGGESSARFNLTDSAALRGLLEELAVADHVRA
jgi:trehalose 6-phosphate synthase/phosphatase